MIDALELDDAGEADWDATFKQRPDPGRPSTFSFTGMGKGRNEDERKYFRSFDLIPSSMFWEHVSLPIGVLAPGS